MKDIEKSESLLKYFVFMVPSLYDERYRTINIHSLLHLPETVKELGPLWSTSCFAFEGANGELLKLFHGNINAVHVFQQLPCLLSSISEKSIVFKFICSVMSGSSHRTPYFALLGKPNSKSLTDKEKEMTFKYFGHQICRLNFHSRACIRGVTYHSEDYTRVTKRNSYSVKFLQNDELAYGLITWFAEPILCQSSDEEPCNAAIALIKVLEELSIDIYCRNHENFRPDQHIRKNFMQITLPHMKFMTYKDDTCIVKLKDIIDLCVCVEVDQFTIILEEPNHHEKNL
ncbi:hypothetical protein FSP39_009848 [Pinctada imbricata]|uniref:Uncharacterized protein n=1 Tax=Pinctada imbricata TaxID=66713 RepID=A0AA88YVS3_PINIB|nr:hypothetical protein FSP39_009848 [Pinctada imbricata]